MSTATCHLEGHIIEEAIGYKTTGIYEVNGKRYVYTLDAKNNFLFCIGRGEDDIHAAWLHGYKEEIERAEKRGNPL